MMQTKRRGWLWLLVLLLGTYWGATAVVAQEESTPPVARLEITGSDIGSLPTVELHLYGRDGQGNPLDLSQETLAVQHDGRPAGPVEYLGAHTVGTFTVFLFDIPAGVAGELPALQDAINQFASPGFMAEQLDSVAVYQAGETAAAQLLAPTSFHNSVRNLFAQPLTPATGATALIDSTAALLDQIETLKPNEQMASSIVLMSDGTDVVSTRFEENDLVEQALELGVPIHTVWLDNENIGTPAVGQNFLADLAADTGGVAVRLQNTADLALIWDRIAGFRDQARIGYTVADLTSGTFTVDVSLAGDPSVQAQTSIEIPNNIPSVVINLPAESRTLSLPDLEDPVRLRFDTSVSWLDGEEREITAAQLVVNTVAYDVPADGVDEFEAEVNNLTYGNNSVEVVIIDNQGIRATSPTVILSVSEGRRSIPDELNAGGGFLATLLRVFIILVVLGVVGGVAFLLWRGGGLARLGELVPRGPSRRRRAAATDPARPQQAYVPTHTIAYLEVLEAVSRVDSPIPLSSAVIRIGRSPQQCDIVFENDITMSRRHASLMLEGNHYRIFDEQSTSGTWVNERQVPEYGTQLMDGDEVHLGAVHLRFRQA